jgi:putative ABC transport system permease protein
MPTSAPESLITQVQRYVHVVELVLAGIGLIGLAIAALGISNAMLAAIRERRREIGVLKAVGATDRDVRRVFLVEAGTLGFAGGVIGATIGFVVAHILATVVNSYLSSEGLQTVRLGVPVGLLAAVIGGATLLALAAGTLPAIRAARMPARQAIGDE